MTLFCNERISPLSMYQNSTTRVSHVNINATRQRQETPYVCSTAGFINYVVCTFIISLKLQLLIVLCSMI